MKQTARAEPSRAGLRRTGRRWRPLCVRPAFAASVLAMPVLVVPLLALCLAGAVPRAAAAVTRDDFLVRNTGDLVALCAASPSDPHHTAAVNFCQGFAVGVFRVLQVENAADPAHKLFCLPSPVPSRNATIAAFVRWAEAGSSRAGLAAHDGIAMFLEQRFPCGQGK